MQYIVLLVIAFLVFRFLRKKSANAKEERQAAAVKQQMQSGNLNLKANPIDKHSEFAQELFQEAKANFEAVRNQADNLSLIHDNVKDAGILATKHGLDLIRNYVRGYGVDQEPELAARLYEALLSLWQNTPIEEGDITSKWVTALTDNLPLLADAYCLAGDQKSANLVYRQALDRGIYSESPKNQYCNVLRHALGDMGWEDSELLKPVSFEVAWEFALALCNGGGVTAERYAGQVLTALSEMKPVVSQLGKSWEKDVELYSAMNCAYAKYRVGMATLYGYGITQDVGKGLKMIDQAYEQGYDPAADFLCSFYSHYSTSKLDKAGTKLVNDLRDVNRKRVHKIWNSKDKSYNAESNRWMEDPDLRSQSFQLMRQYLTNPEKNQIMKDRMAGKRYFTVPASQSGTSGQSAGSTQEEASAYDLNQLPTYIYDDNNVRWRKYGVYGDHADYTSDNGDTVTIYSADISGSGANTSAGYFHWF